MSCFWTVVRYGHFKHGKWTLDFAGLMWVLTSPSGDKRAFFRMADADEYVMAQEGR